MDRGMFERIRDLRSKRIEGDIALLRREPSSAVHVALGIPVWNPLGVNLRLAVRWNHVKNKKSIAVYVPGTGVICRLDVDGPRHGSAGRSHKHSLRNPTCPLRNLPLGVVPRPELSGLDVRSLFLQFCAEARIRFDGRILIGH